jgi:hypothetical protein
MFNENGEVFHIIHVDKNEISARVITFSVIPKKVGIVIVMHQDIEKCGLLGDQLNSRSSAVQHWFDHFEPTLAHEAEQAGLLEHSSMVGSAREFLIKRVLKSILPSLVHIGTGKIIDAKGNASNQIDVVLFDPRFPKFEIESGIGMYPLEGVIATIEVKSTLTTTSLKDALDNTLSLVKLTPAFEDARPWGARIKKLTSTGLSIEDAKQKAAFELIPSSYVYAFNSRLRKKGLSEQVNKWFELNKKPIVSDGLCAVLPRIIVAGRSLGLLHDGYIKIDPGNDVISIWKQENKSDPKHIMSFWDTNRRFGWLMIHIVHTVCSRVGLTHAVSGAKYAVDQYLISNDYFSKDMEGKNSCHCLW